MSNVHALGSDGLADSLENVCHMVHLLCVLQPRVSVYSQVVGVFYISLSTDLPTDLPLVLAGCIARRSMGWILAEVYELCITKLWTVYEHSRFQAGFGPLFTVRSYL